MAVETNLVADNDTWRWWLNEGMNHSILELVKNLKLQISILNSEDDPVMTPQIIKERVLNVFPVARLITTGNSGHLFPLENPNWITNQIRLLISKEIHIRIVGK